MTASEGDRRRAAECLLWGTRIVDEFERLSAHDRSHLFREFPRLHVALEGAKRTWDTSPAEFEARSEHEERVGIREPEQPR